ncbi:MAG: class I SAM-dependent methyltransferase [Ignavibacteriaceae bacterium]
MSKDFWNKRYSEQDFAYGIKPNIFFEEHIKNLEPGKVLFLGEGEGRNAIYAAQLKWQVDAVDFSSSAKVKALRLAKLNNVKVNYEVCDLNEYDFKKNYYDLVVMIFLHLPTDIREKIFNSSFNSLQPSGKIIIEAFSKDQINNSSGGPKSVDLLYSENDFSTITNKSVINLFESRSINLEEGEHHRGKADVIRFLGTKI